MGALADRREEIDRDTIKGMSHEEMRKYFTLMLAWPPYKPTAAFREWYDRETRLVLANSRWSAWERICNERQADAAR